MQAFFSIFFQRPSHPVWNAARLGMMSLRTRPPLHLLATRGPLAAKKTRPDAATDRSI
jgi:hypothetical protein